MHDLILLKTELMGSFVGSCSRSEVFVGAVVRIWLSWKYDEVHEEMCHGMQMMETLAVGYFPCAFGQCRSRGLQMSKEHDKDYGAKYFILLANPSHPD